MKALVVIAALLVSASSNGRAAIVLSGDFINGTTTPTLTITDDIVLTVTLAVPGPVGANVLAFDEWTISDGTTTFVTDSPNTQTLAYDLDGTAATIGINGFADNLVSNIGTFSSNDGFIQFDAIAVTNGAAVTIKAGTYTFASAAPFNPLLTDQSFTGGVFLADGAGTRISDIVIVPEPSTLILYATGILVLLRRRREL